MAEPREPQLLSHKGRGEQGGAHDPHRRVQILPVLHSCMLKIDKLCCGLLVLVSSGELVAPQGACILVENMTTSTTTSGPWRQWRKRGRSQRAPQVEPESNRRSVHLSTAVVVMMLLGGIVGLNVNLPQGVYRACGPTVNESGNTYGFPLPWLDLGKIVKYSDDTRLMVIDRQSHCRIDWKMALVNAGIVIGGLTAVAWCLERRIRRRSEARNTNGVVSVRRA
jgi:hypothetical protein